VKWPCRQCKGASPCKNKRQVQLGRCSIMVNEEKDPMRGGQKQRNAVDKPSMPLRIHWGERDA